MNEPKQNNVTPYSLFILAYFGFRQVFILEIVWENMAVKSVDSKLSNSILDVGHKFCRYQMSMSERVRVDE